MLTLPLLLACGPSTLSVGDERPDRRPHDDTAARDTDDSAEHLPDTDTADDTDTTGDTAETDDTEDTVETWPKDCDDIYDPDEVQVFELTFDPGDRRALEQDCNNGSQTYHPVTFTWNGESVPAMVRLKGNWSYSCEKLQFVVSFNEEDPDARFRGLRKVMLDDPWYDRTLLHERMAFPLFRDRGLPYSCVNNAKVYLDGEYYGLYANVERIDREYLERNYEEPDGNLYQGGSELKTNEDVGDTSRLQALQAATTVDAIAELVDLDQAVAEWATEAMIPALDNYWAGVEINYYLYDHPSRGFVYLPYDLDISYGDSAYTSGEPVWPEALYADPLTYEHYGWQKEALVERVLSDRHWCDRFVEELELTRAAWDTEALQAQLDEWAAQIADAYAEDPNKWASVADHEAAIADMRQFIEDRAAFVDGWLAEGDHCPARF